MTQLSNVLMQPNPTEATERLALVEKLEKEYKKWCDVEDNAESDMQAYQARGAYRAIRDCIDIVKQHSDWISADERLPDKDGKCLVYCVGNRELTKDRKELSIMRFNQKTKGGWFALSPLFKVVYWQPIQPPSEVQDETV